MQIEKAKQRSLRPNGVVLGTYDDNPALNSIACGVEFPDRTIREHAAKVIAENILTQVDEDGLFLSLMEGIVDYKRDDTAALSKADKHVATRCG